MAGRTNDTRKPPLKLAGLVLLLILAVIFTFVVMQYRGTLTPKTDVTLISSRAGLVMDPGGKVTYNGLPVGRVLSVEPLNQNGKQVAQLKLEINNRYVPLIPSNVGATIDATTIFGNKYVSLKSPSNPTTTRIANADVIDATNVTTEFNTLFETITSLAEKVDPVKLNLTLSATAEALTGLGGKLGVAIGNANEALDDLNPQLPTLRYDLQQLVGFADVYTNAAPDLLDALDSISITSRPATSRRRRPPRCSPRSGSATTAPTSSSAARRTWCARWRTWCPRRRCSTPTARRSTARCAAPPRRCRWPTPPWAATATR